MVLRGRFFFFENLDLMGDCYIFAHEIKKVISMEKYLLDPKAPGAFSPDVMHKVVLNGINFELPEYIWDAIDDAFGNYWNVEVGYGGWPDLNSAVRSISNWLKKEHIVFPVDKIADIVNIMFDWIEQIPGATLDDDEVVIPSSFEEEEEERQIIKRLAKENEDLDLDFFLPLPNFNDPWTDFVYISDKLKEFYPSTYTRLTKLFDEMEIEWAEVKDTKDIWIRDYMPIQLSEEHFLVYKYDPDYMKDTGKKYLTDSKTIYKGVLHDCELTDSGIILDGGNVVSCSDYRILTDKVFIENGKELYDMEFCRHIQQVMESKVIYLPWHCDNPENPYADVYGHADGIVKWTGGNTVLMSNHREFHPDEADEIRNRLENAGFEVTEMLFDVPNPNRDFNWAYINYLRVDDMIIVPTFGIPEDKQALKYIREANPECIVRGFRMRDIVRNGGGLHCITWNIRK